MCDCFHLAFPNWHGPATGAGRRLRGPEQDTEDDSVCDEPEILEGERPRPQGSSPVEEFPAEKKAEDNIDIPHKSGSIKKSRRVGFGSLFDKRSSAKMRETEDIQGDGTEVIVKMVKETCAEGLIVTGGGKEGIFIKEVKPDSPASRHLTVKEGDQILSATVYFDNVSYEDALQILEHAHPYKMEFCLRRKVESPIPEDYDIHPEDNEGGSPQMRSPRKKKQQDRISWPKFPTFGKAHRAQFKRSHSTSEAEEHKKLEMSPPTSDTESPCKSPLKSPDGKDKKKKQKIKLKMKGHRSKSAEDTQRKENELTSENSEISQGQDEAEYKDLPKTASEHAFPNVSEVEIQHKVHLISLTNTLKTTDVSDALTGLSGVDIKTQEEGKVEISKLKVSIPQKEKSELDRDSQAKDILRISRTSDPSTYDTVVCPVTMSEAETSQLYTDVNTEEISKDSSVKKQESGSKKEEMPKPDISVDLSDVGALKSLPRPGSDKQWKERTVFENETYGIRTRGPLADMATSKTYFASTVNGLQFMPSDSFETTKASDVSETVTIISQPKPNDLSADLATDAKDSALEINVSRLPMETNFDDILAGPEKRSKSEYKLPKVKDHSGIVIQEPVRMTQVELKNLPKREDIEIPGMEDKVSKRSHQTAGIKVPKLEKIINITKEREIQAQRADEDFNVEDVKEAVSKFPALKLPEGDITGVLVQREITIMEMKADKTNITPRGSPRKISSTSDDYSMQITKTKIGKEESSGTDLEEGMVIKVSNVQQPYADEQTVTMTKIDYTKPKGETQQIKSDKVLITGDGKTGDIKFKLPKREDIEIPGMEAIEESIVQTTDIKVKKDLHQTPELQGISSSILVEQPSAQISHTEVTQRHIGKKSKITQMCMPSIGITKPDIRFPDIGIELPTKEVTSKKDTGEIKEVKLEVDVPHIDIKLKDISGPKTATDHKITKMKTSLPDTKVKLPAQSADIKYSDEDTVDHIVNVEMMDIKTEMQSRKFKLPKFEISIPEVKAPKMIVSASRKDVPKGTSEWSEDISAMDVDIREPKETFDISVDYGHIKEDKISVSDVKLKLPAKTSPEPKKSPDTQMKLPIRPLSFDMEKPEIEEDTKTLFVNMNAKESQNEGQAKKFKLPKFGIKFPEVKGPKLDLSAAKTDLEISLPERKIEVPHQDGEVQELETKVKAVPELESKNIDLKTLPTASSFPIFGLSKSEVKVPDTGVSQAEGSIGLDANITVTIENASKVHQKDERKFGSPTKFKLPSISLPKFGAKVPKEEVDIASVDVQAKEFDIRLPDSELKLSAEPVLVDVKEPEIQHEEKSLSVDMKSQDIQTETQGSTFKLPKFGISLPEVKGPKLGTSSTKTEKDISVPEGKMEVHLHDTKVLEGEIEVKTDIPEMDSKKLDVKMKRPSFSFPKFGFSKTEMKASEADLSLPHADVSVTEVNVDLEGAKIDTKVATDDIEQKDETKFGSPTKFKLPSITLPKFGAKAPKEVVEISAVDVQTKGHDISLPDSELEISAEKLSVDVKMPDVNTQGKSLSVDMKAQEIPIQGQGSTFKLPKFGISLPEVKGPKLDLSTTKTDVDVPLPEANMEVNLPDIEVSDETAKIKADLPKIDSKGIDMKTKQPSFSFPKFGFSKSERKAPETEVSFPQADVSVEKGNIDLEGSKKEIKVTADIDIEQKDKTKFGSPTKFKLPSITLPKFGAKVPKEEVDIAGVDVQAKGIAISLPESELKLSAEPVLIDIKGPEIQHEETSLLVDMKAQDIPTEKQGSTFKLPKFGISLPEVKGPKLGSSSAKTEKDISVPEGKMEVHLPDSKVPEGETEVKTDIPEMDSKKFDVKMKRPSFSFPKFGFSKTEMKAPEADLSIPHADMSVTEVNVDLEAAKMDTKVATDDLEQKDETRFGSPTKFKLPSITLPKFGAKAPKEVVEISAVDVQAKGHDISLPDAELEMSAETLSVDVKMPDVNTQGKSLSVDMKAQEIPIQGQGSTFKLPKFGISLPEVKGPKIDLSTTKTDVDVPLPVAKMEVHLPHIEVSDETAKIKADLPKIDSDCTDMKTKQPSFSFPKFGFSKSEMKAQEADVKCPQADVSIEKGEIDLEVSNKEVKGTTDDFEQKGKTKFGSPTKFKLPSITLPKFGAKVPKEEVDIAGVDVQAKGIAISLPESELKLSAEPVLIDIKGPEIQHEENSLLVDMKAQDIPTEKQGSIFKLPKFGISLPEVKGPKLGSSSAKTEKDISVPEGKMEVHLPDTKVPEGEIEVKTDIPEMDSKKLDVKMKRPSFSFPKFGFSKTEMKASEADLSLPHADVSVTEVNVDLEVAKIDTKVATDDLEQKDETRFGSPTKFKLPSITLPQFGAKAPKEVVEISAVDVQAKGHDISLPDAELEMSAETLSVDVKMPDVNTQGKSLSVDMKAQEIPIQGQGSTFKLPKFGISLPEVKGPKLDLSTTKTDVDVPLPETKMEVHLPDIEVSGETAKIKADLPKIDSEGTDIKTKHPSFSFPKFGFSKSEMKAQEADVKFPQADVSIEKGEIDLEVSNKEVKGTTDDFEQKGKTKFGSPTKFKLPSITLPKFGAKVPKEEVNIDAVELQAKGLDITLADAELKLSAEPVIVDVKGPEIQHEEKSLPVDMKSQDIRIEKQGSTFKLPKFGISLPEVKGPKMGSSSLKAEKNISVPEGKMEVHLPDTKVPEGEIEVKADIPEIDSKKLDVKIKRPSFSFPKFGFSKTEMKASEADLSLPHADVSVTEVNIDLEGAEIETKVATDDLQQKDETKFGSPTKIKLPSITLPKFGAKVSKEEVDIASVDLQAKGVDITLADAELKLSTEPVLVDIKGPEIQLEEKSLCVDMKSKDIQTEKQGSTFKLPKFGISLPEVKGPNIGSSSAKAEMDSSIEEGKMEVHLTDTKVPEGEIEVKTDIPEMDSKKLVVKIKKPSFSFPKFGFSKTEMKASEADLSLPHADVSVTEVNVDLEGAKIDTKVATDDIEQKDETKFGSPTKFKLPSITLPKFGAKAPKEVVEISAVDVQTKGHDISLPDSELEISAEKLSVDVKMPDVNTQGKSLSVDMKAQEILIEGQGSTFKLPKFGISLPEVKGPKIDLSTTKTDVDVPLPEAKMEVHLPDIEVSDETAKIKADLPKIDSDGTDMKTKQPSFSFPKFGFSKSEMKVQEADVKFPQADVSIEKGEIDLEVSNKEVKGTTDDFQQKDKTKFGSPTKFKLPSITLPKFGAKVPKEEVDIAGVDVQAKGIAISLPESELKLSAEPVLIDIKGPEIQHEETSLLVDMKAQDIPTEKQGSTFKLPKFGISLPEVKGPKLGSSSAKTEKDISVPEGKMEVHLPDTKVPEGEIKVKTDIPEMDSKKLDVKMKRPSFSFPKFGFSKTEMKASEADLSLPHADVSVTEVNVDLEVAKIDTKVATDDLEQKDETKFGSPTKFKLPSITLPKFRAKAPKEVVEISAVDVQAKGHDISLPDAELEMSAEKLSVDVKLPDVNTQGKSLSVDMKAQEIPIEGQGSTFKLPKFGISLPEVKGPKLDLSTTKTDVEVSLPEAKMEVHLPDIEVSDETAKIKADLPKIDSEGIDMKTKQPSFSFPKFGFSKSERKAPKAEVSFPQADVSIEKGNIDLEGSKKEIKVTTDIDIEQKDKTKFGSPTKFKLPSITFPKFGAKISKEEADIADVDVHAKGLDISLPESELKLSAEPLLIDVKGPEIQLEEKSLPVEMKAQDVPAEKQGTTFKLPKFGISLPEVKGPKLGSSSAKAEMESSIQEGKMEVHLPDTKVPKGDIEVKTDIPEIDSKKLDVKMKRPSFSFPKFGFSKTEIKATEADLSLPHADVSVAEVNIDLEEAKKYMKVATDGPKDRTKFGIEMLNVTPEMQVDLPEIDSKGLDVKPKQTNISFPKFGLPRSQSKVPEADVNLPNADVTVELEGTQTHITVSTGQVEGTKNDSPTKFTLPSVKLPKSSILEIKAPDLSFPKSSSAQAGTSMQEKTTQQDVIQSQETKEKEYTAVKGSPNKFKLPSFKMPTFGNTAQKTPETSLEVAQPKRDIAETHDFQAEPDIKDTAQQPPEAAVKMEEGEKGSTSKFKLPTIKMSKIGISKTKSKDDYKDATNMSVTLPEVIVEAKHKEDTQGHDKSSRLTIGDVLMGFDVEFNMPSLDEIEGTKTDTSTPARLENEKGANYEPSTEGIAKYKEGGTQEISVLKFKLPKLGFNVSSDEGNKIADQEATLENSEKQSLDQTYQKPENLSKPEKPSWFRFPKFSSPTKTTTLAEKESSHPPEKTEDSPVSHLKEEPEQSSSKENEEDSVSPTLSLRSSDAFADPGLN
ncbi:neuroblast differentiation-associated protein AHNAK-like isoform X2 [Hoplias malabaricus]|uniref:neuroblast differentiation-associated protein AHNAK-like isoform X2 n=1 Tax=Hoplias malabaricus TaxID=27720 RepID=UPI0034635FEE